MLNGLQAEIDKHPDLSGASPRIVMEALNAPGSAQVEVWITAPGGVLKSLNEIYTYYISDASLARLITYLQQPENAVTALRLEKAQSIDLAAPLVISMLADLLAAGVCTQTEYDTLIRLGQIQKSRAEELFGRKINMEDF